MIQISKGNTGKVKTFRVHKTSYSFSRLTTNRVFDSVQSTPNIAEHRTEQSLWFSPINTKHCFPASASKRGLYTADNSYMLEETTRRQSYMYTRYLTCNKRGLPVSYMLTTCCCVGRIEEDVGYVFIN